MARRFWLRPIFYHSAQQKTVAEQLIAELTKDKFFNHPIVTELTPAGPFFIAEAYHQEYFARNPFQPYCSYVVAPKLAKFRKAFAEKIKA